MMDNSTEKDAPPVEYDDSVTETDSESFVLENQSTCSPVRSVCMAEDMLYRRKPMPKAIAVRIVNDICIFNGVPCLGLPKLRSLSLLCCD